METKINDEIELRHMLSHCLMKNASFCLTYFFLPTSFFLSLLLYSSIEVEYPIIVYISLHKHYSLSQSTERYTGEYKYVEKLFIFYKHYIS